MGFYTYINKETKEELEVMHSISELETGVSDFSKKKNDLPDNFNELYERKQNIEAPILKGFDRLGQSSNKAHRFSTTANPHNFD
jgi:hypothetical protein